MIFALDAMIHLWSLPFWFCCVRFYMICSGIVCRLVPACFWQTDPLALSDRTLRSVWFSFIRHPMICDVWGVSWRCIGQPIKADWFFILQSTQLRFEFFAIGPIANWLGIIFANEPIERLFTCPTDYLFIFQFVLFIFHTYLSSVCSWLSLQHASQPMREMWRIQCIRCCPCLTSAVASAVYTTAQIYLVAMRSFSNLLSEFVYRRHALRSVQSS